MSDRPITEDDLQAYVDRALDPTRQAEVADYLSGHPEVARRVEGYRRQREDLRTALAPVAEEPVPPELNLARLIEARPSGFATWRSAAAAVLLLFAGGIGGWGANEAFGPERGGVTALVQEAADSYAVYAPDRVRPVEIRSARRPELVDWMSERLSHPMTVPDLSRSGYRLMGGRVVATPHGPAAMLMYDDDRGTRLVMLARTMRTDKNAPMSRHELSPPGPSRREGGTIGGIGGIGWADQGMGYSLVGPLPPDALHPIADELRRQLVEKT